MLNPQSAGALSRFTVLDLSRVRAGPTCVKQLGDWGANIIKIEGPAHLPELADPHGAREESDFQNLHRNKRSITLNLKDPAGLAAFKRMVAKADVVVENFRPDVKKRLGIDYESLKAVNKRIILASISGFGQDGPYANRPGVDQIAQGMGGLMSITGEPGRGPMRVGIPIADLCAGIFCGMGILIALHEREVSGEGQWVQSSLLQAQLFMLDLQAVRYLSEGEVAAQVGNLHPTGLPTGVFKTSDGHINIGAGGQLMWERFARTMGHPEWIDMPEFRQGADRFRNRDKLMSTIDALTRTKTSAEWVEFLNKAGVPCGPINSIGQTFEDPQVKTLDMAWPFKKSDGTPVTVLGQPIKMSRTPAKLHRRTPDQGEHNDEVFAEFGFSKDEVASLRSAGVI